MYKIYIKYTSFIFTQFRFFFLFLVFFFIILVYSNFHNKKGFFDIHFSAVFGI